MKKKNFFCKKLVAGPVIDPNVFIGKAAETFTQLQVAERLGVSSSDLQAYSVDVFNNVSFRLDVPATLNNSLATSGRSFVDLGGNVKSFTDQGTFRFGGGGIIYMPGVNSFSLQQRRFGDLLNPLDILSMPLAQQVGSTVDDDSQFLGGNTNYGKLIVHPNAETNNGGGSDGDITRWLTYSNSSVNYSANTTSPAQVGAIAVDKVGGKFLELSWAAPSSANAILGYAVFVNGDYHAFLASNSGAISKLSLNTTYLIKVLTIDVNGNFSPFSAEITQATSATYLVPFAKASGYYPYDVDYTDAIGSNDGNNSGASISAGGIVGNCLDLTASTAAKVTVPSPNDYDFGDSVNDIDFSIAFWGKLNAATNKDWVRKQSNSNVIEFLVREFGNPSLYVFDGSNSVFIQEISTVGPTIGQWMHYCFTYKASTKEIKFYKDAVQVPTTRATGGTYSAMHAYGSRMDIGSNGVNNSNSVNGFMDELIMCRSLLEKHEIEEIVEKNLAGLKFDE